GATADETGPALQGELGLAVGKALLLLGAAYLLGTRVVPWLFARVAATGSRELFLLASLSLAFGLAGASFGLGLSVAFGAFLAGLVISESEFSYQALAEVLPLREVFATIFFVTLGMLIDPNVLVDDPGHVAAITSAVIVGKLLMISVAVALLGYPSRRAVLAGLALAQMGEFSFVLARVGVDEGVISDSVNSSILMSALVSIVFTPFLVEGGPRIVAWLAQRPLLGAFLQEPAVPELGDHAQLHQHVVVCGYGDIGRELVHEVLRRGFRCVVIDENPYLIAELRREGIPRVFGDAANPAVLGVCALDRARVLAVTIPDPAAARLVLPLARRMNDQLDIIVRGRGSEDRDALRDAGAGEVVQPEFEAGLEFVRHTLHRYGVDRTQIQALLARRRRDVRRYD
ncbi:MAG: cation:proton antiporter, partial [Dehalococcoidia bacterium]|nr:cation:proton antiporter [Dehalococcoidia bacterium]